LSSIELIERYRKVRVADMVEGINQFGFPHKVLVSSEIRPLYPG